MSFTSVYFQFVDTVRLLNVHCDTIMTTRKWEASCPYRPCNRGRKAKAAGSSEVSEALWSQSASSERMDHCSLLSGRCLHPVCPSGSQRCLQEIPQKEGEGFFYTQSGSTSPWGQQTSEWDEAGSHHLPSLSAGVCSPAGEEETRERQRFVTSLWVEC